IDHAGVLARTLDHPGRLGGQGAQMDLGGLVRAVLVPHRREDAELGETRRARDQRTDALILVRLEPMGLDQRRGHGWLLDGLLACHVGGPYALLLGETDQRRKGLIHTIFWAGGVACRADWPKA